MRRLGLVGLLCLLLLMAFRPWVWSQVVPSTEELRVGHITSLTHIGGGVFLTNLVGTAVTVTGTALDVNCTGCSAASNVRVDHVSAVTHVSGRIILSDVAGNPVTVTAGELNVNCTGCSAASVVNVGHISGALHVAGGFTSNVGHISAAIHLAGGVTDNANAALRVTGVTVFTIMGALDHVATQVHVAGVGISPQFTMFRVNCGTTAATAVSVTTTRKRVILQNVGTLPIYIGGGHVTVTASNAFTLHAVSAAENASTTSRLELTDFQGRVDCISDGPGQTLEVLQVLGGR